MFIVFLHQKKPLPSPCMEKVTASFLIISKKCAITESLELEGSSFYSLVLLLSCSLISPPISQNFMLHLKLYLKSLSCQYLSKIFTIEFIDNGSQYGYNRIITN